MTGAPGWDQSAAAWIVEQGAEGDYGRKYVLDGPMLARIRGRGFRNALDLGCGEGRFCRMLRDEGIETVGIDPTEALIRCARERDPNGDYRLGAAEQLACAASSFDLVVSYLTLIDIADLDRTFAEIDRVLRPGGTFLLANLTSYNTAGLPDAWRDDTFKIDHYMEERAVWVQWRGIQIQNWHRPLCAYIAPLLARGFELRYFAEPMPTGGDPARLALYRRVPYFHVMEWEKRPIPGSSNLRTTPPPAP